MTRFFILQMAPNYSRRFGYPFGEKKYSHRCGVCGRPVGGPGLPITIRFEGRVNNADFVSSSPELLVTHRVRTAFEENRIKGVQYSDVIIKFKDVKPPPEMQLWHLLIHQAAHASPQMNIVPLRKCSECGIVDYSTWDNGVFIDEMTWDGSDIFRLFEDVVGVVCTEKVKDLVEREKFTGVVFIPAEKFHDPFPESRSRPKVSK